MSRRLTRGRERRTPADVISVEEARAHFAAVLARAQRRRVVITRHGRPVAVISAVKPKTRRKG